MQLDTIYAAPGALFLATGVDGERLGCVGLRSIGDGVGEVRRLFVRDMARGLGLGRTLMAELNSHAAASGLTQVVLNTMPAMATAVELYESLGYEPITPYVDEPEEGTLYLGAALAGGTS